MEFQDAMQELNKNKISPIYTLLGSETYLRNQFIDKLISNLGDIDSNDISRLDMNEITIDDVLDEADTFSFFSEYRVLFVTNVEFLSASGNQKLTDSQQKRLISYLKNPNQASIILFIIDNNQVDKRKKITKEMMKLTKLIDLSSLDEGQVNQYIQRYLENEPTKYTREAVSELLMRVDYDLSKAMNEINKLNIYSQSKMTINIDIVRQLVPRTLESDVFQLTNAVAAKQIARATQIYKDLLLMKNEPIALHALMISQFRIILQSFILRQQGLNQGDIAKRLSVHPYRVKLALESASRMQLSELMNFYLELAEVDYYMKTGIGDKENYFYILLTKINAM